MTITQNPFYDNSAPSDIISIGEAMVELSTEGDIRFASGFKKSYAGDTLNTIVAAQRLGSKTGYMTRLGHDPFAFGLKELLLKEGIATQGIKTVPGQTGLYIVSVQPDGQREFFYYRKQSAASSLHPDDLPVEAIKRAKVVFASGITLALSESARRTVYKAFQIARENNVMTALDPNYREYLWGGSNKAQSQAAQSNAIDAMNDILPLVDVILPSVPGDTQRLIGFSKPEQVVEYYLFKGVQLVAVKAGEAGCYLGFKKEIQHIPALPSRPVDTTGAGDAFNGGFLHGLVTGHSLTDCAKLGNITAGLKIAQHGTLDALPSQQAVYQLLNKHSG